MSIEAAVPALGQTRPFRDVRDEFALPLIAVVKAINRKRRQAPIPDGVASQQNAHQFDHLWSGSGELKGDP